MGTYTGSRRVPKATEGKAATRRGTRAKFLWVRTLSPTSQGNRPTLSGGFGQERTRRGGSGIHHLYTGFIFQTKINRSMPALNIPRETPSSHDSFYTENLQDESSLRGWA
jgi:hypothetical protein